MYEFLLSSFICVNTVILKCLKNHLDWDSEPKNIKNRFLELDSESSKREMDENQINQKLRNVSGYLGTYAIDELDSLHISHYPSFIIINLDERANGGTHWIAMAMYQNDVFVCDSLGFLLPSESFPQKMINFLYRITYNRHLHITSQLQPSIATSCGQFAMYFTYFMSTTNNFSDFLCKFSTNLELNDIIVQLYIKNL